MRTYVEHDWPGDLDADAQCYRCGLRYAEWAEGMGCEGPPDGLW